MHDWAPIKIDFIKRHAHALVEELKAVNVELSLIEVPYFSDQISYLKQYCQDQNIETVFANSELEFNEQQRDRDCKAQGIPLILYESDVIVSKGKVLNQSGAMFKVFTPFKKAWLKKVLSSGFDYLGKLAHIRAVNLNNKEESLKETYQAERISGTWPLATDYETDIYLLFCKLNYRNMLT